MLIEIANVLGRRISSSIDFIEEDQAKTIIYAALETTKNLLNARIAEVYCLKTTPYFVNAQFRSDTTEDFHRFISVPKTLTPSKRFSSDIYDPNIKGFWKWVYEKNLPVWIETTEEKNISGKIVVENKAPGSENIPAEYNATDDLVTSLVVIPFEHKIEHSKGIWGFFDIEFTAPLMYSSDRYEALTKLADHIASIIWKSKAWAANKEGTANAAEQFAEWCRNWTGAATLPDKTGLFVSTPAPSQAVRDLVAKAFYDHGIQWDEYIFKERKTRLPETQGLGIMQILKKEHFAVIDITHKEQEPNILILLGLLLNHEKRCLVIYDKDDVEDIPTLLTQMTLPVGRGASQLPHLYAYEIKEKEVMFYDRSDEAVTWEELWRGFLNDVRETSSAFRVAHDWYPKKK